MCPLQYCTCALLPNGILWGFRIWDNYIEYGAVMCRSCQDLWIEVSVHLWRGRWVRSEEGGTKEKCTLFVLKSIYLGLLLNK